MDDATVPVSPANQTEPLPTKGSRARSPQPTLRTTNGDAPPRPGHPPASMPDSLPDSLPDSPALMSPDASHTELTQPAPAQYTPPRVIESTPDYSDETRPARSASPGPAIRRPAAPHAPHAAHAAYPAHTSHVAQAVQAGQSVQAVQVTPPGYAPPTTAPRRNWAVVGLAALVLFVTLAFGAVAMVGARLFTANQPASAASALSQAAAPTEAALPTFDMPTVVVGTQIEPWDGQERFTILFMGLDKRPGDNGTAFRTDSMMVISIDPATRSIGILSIPRDLYIEIPPNTIVGSGYGLQRVNSAYAIGELAQPGAGAHLAMQTVQYNLGMRIHDYVVYDFNAVIDAINVVGGIEVNVQQPIDDPAYPDMAYGYDPLYIPAGLIHMNGDLALKYARSRHQTSDIDRARRQQEVIMAVRERVLNVNLMPDLLMQAPNLWNSLSRHVQTGLTLDQVLRLVVYLKDLPRENIRQAVIDYRYVIPTLWDGASVLVPTRDLIGPLLVETFGPTYNQ